MRGNQLGGREGEAAAIFSARRAATGEAGKREKEGGRASSPPRGAPGVIVRRRAAAERWRPDARAAMAAAEGADARV
jgi:hypothetical protein